MYVPAFICFHERSRGQKSSQKSMNLEVIWPYHHQGHRMSRTSKTIQTKVVLSMYHISYISNVNHMFLFWFWHHMIIRVISRWMDVDVIWYERWLNPRQSPSELPYLLVHTMSVAVGAAERWLFQTHVPLMVRMQIRVAPSLNWNWWLQCKVSGLLLAD